MKYQDIEVGLNFDPEPGLVDNGDLEHDLQALLEAAGEAAQEAETALAILSTSRRSVLSRKRRLSGRSRNLYGIGGLT